MLYGYDEWFDFVFSDSLPSFPSGFLLSFLQLLLLSDCQILYLLLVLLLLVYEGSQFGIFK